MNPIKITKLDSVTFAEAMRAHGITVTEVEDLTGKVPHVATGGAAKLRYTSPKTGLDVYVLERCEMFDADAFAVDIWQFSTDFTVEQARAFLESQR